MRSIVVLNAKGGCGKTTVATNLAGCLAARGKRVALADFDPQGSSSDWLAARPQSRAPILGIRAFESPLRVPPDTDWLVIDAPSRTHDDLLVNLVRRAQTLLMPVLPSPLDVRAAERFLGELYALRRIINARVKLAVIANRVRDNTRAAAVLEDFLDNLTLPDGRRLPFLAVLRASANYLRAAERGLSVFEFAPFATVQDRQEWQPLLRWLANPASVP